MRARRPSAGTVLAILVAAAIIAFLAVGAANDGAANSASIDDKAQVAAAAFGFLTLLVIRLSALVGPVVFSAADIQWRLSAPEPRAPLVRGRLRRQAVATGLLGVIVGGLVLVSFAPHGLPSPGVSIGAALVGCAFAWASVPFAGWMVQSSRRLSRWATLPTLLLIVVVWSAAALVGGHSARGITGVLAGPLAWPFVGFAGGAGTAVASAIGALAVLSAAVVGARLRAEAMSLERFEQRATAREMVSGSVLTLDWRVLLVALQTAPSARAMRHPRRAPTAGRGATRWLFLALALRAPGRLVIASAVAVGAGAWAISGAVADDGAVAIAVALLAYAAATGLAEPIRVAYDSAVRTESTLGRAFGSVAMAQTLMVAAIVGVLFAAGAGVAAVIGDGAGVIPAVLLCAPAIALSAAAAAVSSARAGGRVPTDVIVVAAIFDPNIAIGYLGLWLVRWPLLAVAGGSVPLAAAFESAAPHASFASVPLAALVAIAISALFLMRGSGWRPARAGPGSR